MHMVDDLKLVYPLSLGVPHDQEKGQSELELNSFLSFFMSLHIYIYTCVLEKTFLDIRGGGFLKIGRWIP